MKIAIVHLSDFHIHAGEKFLPQKINGVLAALNVLGKVDTEEQNMVAYLQRVRRCKSPVGGRSLEGR